MKRLEENVNEMLLHDTINKIEQTLKIYVIDMILFILKRNSSLTW
jgi:hypothetical protein